MGNLIPLDRAVGIDAQRKYSAQMEDKGNFSPESITMATKILETAPGKREYIARGLSGYPVDKDFNYGNYGMTFGSTEAQKVFPTLSKTTVYKSVPDDMLPGGSRGMFDAETNAILVPAKEEIRGDIKRLTSTMNHETQHAIDRKEILDSSNNSAASSEEFYQYDSDPFEIRANVASAMSPGRFGKLSLEEERNVDTAGLLSANKRGLYNHNIDSVNSAYFDGAYPIAQQILKRSNAARK